jgi:branched-chain amino acid transport system permease protein
MKMFEALVQNLVYGVLIGALYGLAAVGLSLVFGVTKFLNVAHGEFLMVGGYASFWLFALWKIDPFISLPAAVVSLLVLGAVFYQALFSRMVKLTESVKIQNTLLIGFGVSLILQNLALKLWTADTRSITTAYSGTVFNFLGIRFPLVRVASMVIALILVIALQLFLRRTYTGKALRATVENWEAATLMGIDIHQVYLLSFVMGAALAGVAGALVGVGYSIEPGMGMSWTLKSLVVMVLGGLGSITGTFIGGIILGLTESATGFLSLMVGGGLTYKEVVGLVLFLLVLVFRPQGLFGTKEG